MANLERHLSEIGAATRAAVEEIRERPAYDPTDVRALLQRIETWRGDKPSSDLPGIDIKLDAIARQVEQLSKSDHRMALAKIQEGLGELIGIVSAQNTNLSGLDLAGLQNRLAEICDVLSTNQGDRRVGANTLPSINAGFGDSHEDDEDDKLAKQLAVRFAPQGEPRRVVQTDEEPETDDVSGAFDALQEALEALVGQIPFVERTWESGGRSPGPQEDRAAVASPSASERQTSDEPASAGAGSGKDRGSPYALGPAQPTDRPPNLASSKENAAPPTSEAQAPREKPVPSTQNSPAVEDRATYADAAHRIGRYSTWRKAKVAVVAANTPKY
jgi:hypothetical protein